jgi:hypothetical protein
MTSPAASTDSQRATCQVCGRYGVEINYSDAVGAWCCLACYCQAPSSRLTSGVRQRRSAPPAPPARGRYTEFVERVRDAIRLRTGHAPQYLEADRMASYCPVCGIGTVSWRFSDSPVQVVSHSQDRGSGYCSEGCTEAEMMAALS